MAFVAASLPSVGYGQTEPPASDSGRTEERIGDWALRCVAPADGSAKRCEMVQVLGDNKSNRDLLLVAIGYPDGQSKAVAWLILPLGVLLPPGIGLRIDDGETGKLPFRSCDNRGCAVPWALSEQDIAGLKRGTKLTVIFKDIEGQSLGVPVSLSGFTAAFDKLQ